MALVGGACDHCGTDWKPLCPKCGTPAAEPPSGAFAVPWHLVVRGQQPKGRGLPNGRGLLPEQVMEYIASQREMHRAVQRLISGKPMPPEERSMLITQLEISAAVGQLIDEIGDQGLSMGITHGAQTTTTLSQLHPKRLRFRLTIENLGVGEP
jgi:hypothetical protein